MQQQRGCLRAPGASRTCTGWRLRPGGVPGDQSGGADVRAPLQTQALWLVGAAPAPHDSGADRRPAYEQTRRLAQPAVSSRSPDVPDR
jgi:hypothetical protein